MFKNLLKFFGLNPNESEAPNRSLDKLEVPKKNKLWEDEGYEILETLKCHSDTMTDEEISKLKEATEVVKKYTDMAYKGDANAQYQLGLMYDNLNMKIKAIHWYGESVQNGNLDAQYNLANLYRNEGNTAEALDNYKEAALLGHAESAYHLGNYYKYHYKDTSNALKWFTLATNKQHVNACRELIEILIDKEIDSIKKGDIAEKNTISFITFYIDKIGGLEKLSNFEITKKNEFTGEIIEIINIKNLNLPNDLLAYLDPLLLDPLLEKLYNYALKCTTYEIHAEAYAIYKRFAIDLDHAESQYNLGVLYEYGEGVKQNDEEAIKWYEKAALKGHLESQNNLGLMYVYKATNFINYQKALEWFSKAANQNHAQAQYNLGSMYNNGDGTKQDFEKAKEWYKKACQNGDKMGCESYNDLVMRGY